MVLVLHHMLVSAYLYFRNRARFIPVEDEQPDCNVINSIANESESGTSDNINSRQTDTKTTTTSDGLTCTQCNAVISFASQGNTTRKISNGLVDPIRQQRISRSSIALVLP